MSELKCYKCKFLCLEDYGYSDYTVEGTWIKCLKNKFENLEQEYDADKEKEQEGLIEKASANCTEYVEGEPLSLNVDYDCGCTANGGKYCKCCHETEKEKRLSESTPKGENEK